MTINIMYKGTFHCYFGEIENYPFEQQTCSFDIYPFKSAGPFKLVSKNLSVHSCIAPGMQVFAYEIVGWNMESSSSSKINLHISNHIVHIPENSLVIEGMPSPSQKITVSFSMKRSVWSVFMVTYLPTILMNAINQATVYIE